MATKKKKAAKAKSKVKPKAVKAKKAKAPAKAASKIKPKAKSKPKAKKVIAKRTIARKHKAKDLCHSELVTIKVTPPDLQMFFERADKYAEGNVSRFLRHAAHVCKTKAP